MYHDEIEEVEDLIGISLYETIKKVGSKFIVYPKKGGKGLDRKSVVKGKSEDVGGRGVTTRENGRKRWEQEREKKQRVATMECRRARVRGTRRMIDV